MNTTPYLPEIEDALSSHAVLHLIDSVSGISRIRDWNGPSGRLLGKRLMEYMDSFEGRSVEDLTIRELNAIIKAAGDEHTENHKRSQAFWAAHEMKEGAK